MTNLEASKTSNFDSLTCFEGRFHRVENAIDDKLGLPFGKLQLVRDSLDQLRLGHRWAPYANRVQK
jgi:hypothetical protein